MTTREPKDIQIALTDAATATLKGLSMIAARIEEMDKRLSVLEDLFTAFIRADDAMGERDEVS